MRLGKQAFLLALMLCVASAWAFAQQQPAGELQIERGRVKIQRGEEFLIVEKSEERTPIFVGDLLHSAKETRAQLFFRDDRDTISLYSSTLFTVDEVSRTNTRFGLNIGRALFRVFSRFRFSRFQLKTSTATIGVKGTEFITATDGRTTYLLTLSGIVTLANIEIPDVVVTVRGNQASVVVEESPPAPPVDITPEEQQEIIPEEGTEGFEDVPFEIPPPVEEEPAASEEQPAEEAEGEEEQAAEEPAAEESDSVEVVLETITTIEENIATGTEEARPSEDVGAFAPVTFSVGR